MKYTLVGQVSWMLSATLALGCASPEPVATGVSALTADGGPDTLDPYVGYGECGFRRVAPNGDVNADPDVVSCGPSTVCLGMGTPGVSCRNDGDAYVVCDCVSWCHPANIARGLVSTNQATRSSALDLAQLCCDELDVTEGGALARAITKTGVTGLALLRAQQLRADLATSFNTTCPGTCVGVETGGSFAPDIFSDPPYCTEDTRFPSTCRAGLQPVAYRAPSGNCVCDCLKVQGNFNEQPR